MEKILEFEDSKHYRFQCDCLTPSDAMDVDVEIGGGKKYITIAMYFLGNGIWDRIKYAYWILRGRWQWREFAVREEDYQHLSDIFKPEYTDTICTTTSGTAGVAYIKA